MKRGQHLGNGTYQYSNGMVGTKDLPEFVATLAYRRHHASNTKAYANLNVKVKSRLSVKDMLS